VVVAKATKVAGLVAPMSGARVYLRPVLLKASRSGAWDQDGEAQKR